MKLISWNESGIRSCLDRGLKNFSAKESPYFFSIQEIKCNEELFKPKGYESFHNFSKTKGY